MLTTVRNRDGSVSLPIASSARSPSRVDFELFVSVFSILEKMSFGSSARRPSQGMAANRSVLALVTLSVEAL